MFGRCFLMHYFASFLGFAIVLKRKRERAGCFVSIVVLMYCDCLCSVAILHGAVGWSVVCDCGIS